MEIIENSNKAMLLLMLCAMDMDGKIRHKELVLYQKLADRLGLNKEDVEALVLLSDKDPVLYGHKAKAAITDPELRKSVFDDMSSIAVIDKEFHPYEKALLASLKKEWGL